MAVGRIRVTGNCQSVGLARCLQAMAPDFDIQHVPFPAEAAISDRFAELAADCDLILAQKFPDSDHLLDGIRDQVAYYPKIIFGAFHPDIVHLESNGEKVFGPMAGYNSLIAILSFVMGVGVAETVESFHPEMFRALGFHDRLEGARAALLAEGQRADLSLDALLPKWEKGGCFMHSINHPHLRVISDLAAAVAGKIGLPVTISRPERFLVDTLTFAPVWPLYPGVSDQFGQPGDYDFKTVHLDGEANSGFEVLSLEAFIARSFAVYSARPDSNWALIGDRKLDDMRDRLAAVLNRSAPARRVRQPYAGLPKHQFWRSAVVEADELDPFIPPPGFRRLTEASKVAAAGSCFAQHMGAALRAGGLALMDTEPAPQGLGAEAARIRHFGLFSARYGNIYTARQLLQLFDRAEGTRQPDDAIWDGAHGYVDPFRPSVEPAGFPTPEALRADRQAHLAAVRQMFRDLDTFIFTLGMTEAWRARSDGSVFPVAPGVSGGQWDPERYEFVNFTYDDVVEDLLAFADRLSQVNPGARIVLTVSPVSLMATYEPVHVLASTVSSKSILRAAAETVARRRDNVIYFPAYEIITAPNARYYEADLRSVTPEGVAHVMAVFGRHFLPLGSQGVAGHQAVFDILCDEDAIAANP